MESLPAGATAALALERSPTLKDQLTWLNRLLFFQKCFSNPFVFVVQKTKTLKQFHLDGLCDIKPGLPFYI